MWWRALDRKLLRETRRLKGQIASIALVLASGIICYIALRGTYASLAQAQVAYYDRYRFAHVFAHAERAPQTLAPRIEALPGVETAQTRVVEEVSLPIEGMARAASGRLLSLSADPGGGVNALCLRKGRYPEPGREDEVVLLEAFASAHGLEPGQRVPVVINGKQRSLRIAGLAISPEFVYAIRPGALVDDPKRHAVLWMARSPLASAFGLDGAFNDVVLRLSPGASEPAVRAALDRLLAAYGGNGAYGRKEQLSNRVLSQELDQLRVLSSMVPAVFLGVAAFLVNLVLGRLIRLQRAELATLKAVGYSNAEIGRHYLGLVIVVMVPGSLLGLVGGVTLGRLVLDLYAGLFRFPALEFQVSTSLVASALLVSGVAAFAGAFAAVYSAVRLPPAEAMQPPAPARYRKSLFDRLGLGTLTGTAGMMVLREIARRPLRTLFSSLGVAGAVSLLIFAHFGTDSLNAYFEGTFRREQRQDLSVSFVRPVAPRVVHELGALRGVLRAEGLHALPVRIRHGHRARDSVLMGLPPGATLRQLVARGGRPEPLPEHGIVLTQTLAQILDLRIGDHPEIELREGERRSVRPLVVGTVDETVGLSVYASNELVARLERDAGAVSSALLSVDPRELESVEAELRRSPHVVDVSDVRSDMQRLLDMNASIIDVWTLVSILLSAGVVFGVVYNNARIGLSARSRELASLRVLGFTRREISLILLGTQAIEVGLAVPLGLFLGWAWARQFMSLVDQETFRWQVAVAPRTYLLAAGVTLIAALLSALWVRRTLDTLDLVSVLKARE